MENNVEIVSLKSLCYDISYGYTESAVAEEVGPHFLRITDIQGGRVDWNTVPYCVISDIDIEKYRLKDHDIVVARTGNSTGENYLFRSDADAVYASYLIKFSVDDRLAFAPYVWYTMRSYHWWKFINGAKTGSAQAGANAKVLGRFQVPLPPRPAQIKIASILSALDNKIDLLRQQNATLEAMAQTLFRSWFVDFDPVIDNALDAGHPLPDALMARVAKRKRVRAHDHYPRLPEAVRRLFPDRFVFSEELGKWVPEGWEVKPLDKLIKVNPKTSLAKGTLAKYADMKSLPTTGYSVSGIIEKEYSGGTKFVNSDVLLARITPCLENGKTGLVDFLKTDEIGFGSTEFIVMRERGDIKHPFIACLARLNDFVNHCVHNMVGSSGRQRVQKDSLGHYFMAVPPKGMLTKFNDQTSPSFHAVSKNSSQIENLVKLRDTLLPPLISGKLSVDNFAPAEEVVLDK